MTPGMERGILWIYHCEPLAKQTPVTRGLLVWEERPPRNNICLYNEFPHCLLLSSSPAINLDQPRARLPGARHLPHQRIVHRQYSA